MTQHDINFVAEFLRDNFNHFTLVRNIFLHSFMFIEISNVMMYVVKIISLPISI